MSRRYGDVSQPRFEVGLGSGAKRGVKVTEQTTVVIRRFFFFNDCFLTRVALLCIHVNIDYTSMNKDYDEYE